MAQIQAQQGGVPQPIKLQLPVQIQQSSPVQTHQIQNVVTVQAASVQEQLQRVQHLRDQQQKKKQQQIEIKREHTLQASNQSEIIQKQVKILSKSSMFLSLNYCAVLLDLVFGCVGVPKRDQSHWCFNLGAALD